MSKKNVAFTLLFHLFIHVYIEKILLNCCNTDRVMLNAKRDIKIKMHGISWDCVYHLTGKLRNEN